MVDFEELQSLKSNVNKLEKQNLKLTQANSQMLQELRNLRNLVHKEQQPNLQPPQEIIQVQAVQPLNLQPAQARIQVQELETTKLQPAQPKIQMQEEEPDLVNSQILLVRFSYNSYRVFKICPRCLVYHL